jgi:integrase/recombinase XerD
MDASPHTIAGYRDAFRLLLRFASEQTGRAPAKLAIEDLDAELVGDFLVYVESERGNSARSRNTRLAAIRSFFRFVAMNEPAYMLHCQRILAMPGKRYVRRTWRSWTTRRWRRYWPRRIRPPGSGVATRRSS